MATSTASNTLTSGTRVMAAIDLKGVPSGTPGKVIHVQGLSWTRYWVWFDNGLRVGTLDRSKLATVDEWERKLSGNDAPVAASAAATGAPAAAAAGGDGAAMESIGGVPGHLIERSRKARERWAAKTAG